ncbi:hypothetical protein ACTFIT_002777 [Dictyostelium discoideum]
MNIEGDDEEFYNFNEDAIYGVFNDGWGDYEDEEESKMTEEEYYKMKKRYSTPVGFVASGIYEPNEHKLKNKDGENIDNDDDDGEEKKKKKKEKKEKKQKKKEKKEKKEKKNKKKNKYGGGGGNNYDDSDNDKSIEDKPVGGIGAALLSKMGYKGTGGLGRDGGGMVEPIKVQVRPKNAGLASVTELNVNSSDDSDDSDQSEGDTDSDNENKRSLGWKKKEPKLKYDFDEHLESTTTTTFKKKTTTTTATTTTSSTPQIVIDMRGPEARLYTGMEEIKHHKHHHHHQHNKEYQNITSILDDQSKPLSELKHNVDLLLKLKQIDIQNQDNKIKHENDKINNLTRGVEKLKLTIENDKEQIKKVTEILETITTVKKQLDQSQLDLKQLYKVFKKLKSNYPKEYQNFKLYNLQKELLEPLLKEKLNQWELESNSDNNDNSSLEISKKLSKEMVKWRQLFQESVSVLGEYQINVYFLIMRDLFLPKFKNYLRSQWDVKKPSNAATLISTWSDTLPDVIQEALLEQSILPKLKVAIEKWDPRTDPIPLDHWLLPWIPLLGSELESFYPLIRQKIISALQDWHPSDKSAIKILTPWKNIFQSNSMDSLLNRAIIPKLSKSIKDLEINPSNQKSPIEIQWLLRWSNLNNNDNNNNNNNNNNNDNNNNNNSITTTDNINLDSGLITLSTIICILEKDFFTRWLKILLEWLKSPDANLEEISNWYSGWKKQFPKEIISNDKIKSIFNISLNLMKKVLSNETIQKDDEILISQKINSLLNTNINNNNNNNNNINNSYQQQNQQQPIKPISSPSLNSSNNNNIDNISTKQMVEQLAIKNGLLFIPSEKKTNSGQQIYIFDKIPIIIERDLIMYNNNNNNRWEPANIQYLLDKSLNK